MWMKYPDIREGTKDVAQWRASVVSPWCPVQPHNTTLLEDKRAIRSLPVTCEGVGTGRKGSRRE